MSGENKITFINERSGRWLIFILACLLFLYTASRAYLMSFTHDESYTFLEYVRKSWTEINNLSYTNNHLLNTWLMKFLSQRYGMSEFVLRLPNVVSHILFLYFSARLLFHIKHPLLMIAGWILVNCNPFVLDFFSLARGYGISMGLMMMSAYGLYQLFFSSNSIKNVLFTIVPLCIAVLANLTMVNVLLAFTSIIIFGGIFSSFGGVKRVLSPKRRWWPVISISCVLVSAFLYFIMPLLFNLKSVGNFDFGGDSGIWDDTIYSLIASSLYGTDKYGYWAVFMLKWITIASIAIYSARILFKLFTKQATSILNFSLILFFILLQCFAAIELQHAFFGIPFSVDRAALYFIPLLTLFVVFAADTFEYKHLPSVFSKLIAVPALGLFAVSFNFKYVHLWEYDSGTRSLIETMKKDMDASPTKAPVVMCGVDFIYEPTFNFYRQRFKMDMVDAANHEDKPVKGNSQYYFLLFGDREGFGTLKDTSFPAGSCLVKNEKQLSYSLKKQYTIDLEDAGDEQTPGYAKTSEAFSGTHIFVTNKGCSFTRNMRDTVSDPQEYKNYTVLFEAALRRGNAAANGQLVICITRGKDVILWKGVSTNEFLQREGEWTHAFYAIDLPADIQKGDVISAYLWNQLDWDIWADKLSLKMYKRE